MPTRKRAAAPKSKSGKAPKKAATAASVAAHEVLARLSPSDVVAARADANPEARLRALVGFADELKAGAQQALAAIAAERVKKAAEDERQRRAKLAKRGACLKCEEVGEMVRCKCDDIEHGLRLCRACVKRGELRGGQQGTKCGNLVCGFDDSCSVTACTVCVARVCEACNGSQMEMCWCSKPICCKCAPKCQCASERGEAVCESGVKCGHCAS